MKSCRILGTAKEDTSKFYTECGAPLEDASSFSKEAAVFTEAVPESQAVDHPMKWHKFLMIVWFAGGIIGIIRSLAIFTGDIYSMYGADSV